VLAVIGSRSMTTKPRAQETAFQSPNVSVAAGSKVNDATAFVGEIARCA
jgi:hypothetical protein